MFKKTNINFGQIVNERNSVGNNEWTTTEEIAAAIVTLVKKFTKSEYSSELFINRRAQQIHTASRQYMIELMTPTLLRVTKQKLYRHGALATDKGETTYYRLTV